MHYKFTTLTSASSTKNHTVVYQAHLSNRNSRFSLLPQESPSKRVDLSSLFYRSSQRSYQQKEKTREAFLSFELKMQVDQAENATKYREFEEGTPQQWTDLVEILRSRGFSTSLAFHCSDSFDN